VPFFQQTEVRQALLYGLDRQALIDGPLAGQGLVADSPIPSMLWPYDPSVRTYLYDPERAIGLLDETGWVDTNGDRIRDKDGVDLSFELLAGDDESMSAMAEEIARQWRDIGVDVEIRSVGADVVQTFVRTRNFDAALVDLVLTADPDPYPLWHSTQAEEPYQNFAGFASEEADLVMEEGRSAVDLERRAELYHEFQRIFKEEVPSLLIYYPIYTYVVSGQVQDVQLGPMLHTSDRFRSIASWYVNTAEVPITEEGPLDNSGE
jgi:peptide/nickel transport system substrate-binding protein